MLDTYIEDTFGKRFVLKRHFDLASQVSLKALSFSDEAQAFQFLSHLRAPIDYWQKTVSKLDSGSPQGIGSAKLCALHSLSKLLYRKQVLVFEIQANSKSNTNAPKRSISKSNGDTFVFSHVSSLLMAQPREVLTIKSKAEAEKLITELAPDEKQLKELTKELGINTLESTDSSANKEQLIAALIAGEVIINIRKPLASPPQRETETEVAAADKPAGLAPESEASSADDTKDNDPMSDINQKAQAATLEKAAEEGTPFCEECAKEEAA